MNKVVRWDIARMGELANAVEAKSARLQALRRDALMAGDQANCVLDMHTAVIAAVWSAGAANEIRKRRRLLEIAERSLASGLVDIGPQEPHSWRPDLQSRSQADIEADLAVALEAGREAAAAELTLELVVSRRNRELMEATPNLDSVAELQRIIDFLAYELARERPASTANWSNAVDAANQIKQLLDESWLRDVTRSDLLAINQIVSALDPTALDAVILQLEDSHLYRWLREMDGVGGGNLTIAEESALFELLARRASAATLFRLASAERDGKFQEIAFEIAAGAPPVVAIEFIEICAAHAAESQSALAAAWGGLISLNSDARVVAYTALVRSGAAATLVAATRELLEIQSLERDDPVIVEFLEGVISGITGTAAALWDLTGAALLDTHRFREAWAGLGRTFALIGEDPIAFVAVVLDLDTLTKNPARWAGATTTDVAAFGMGRLARLGRLGTAAKNAAAWVKQFSSKSIEAGELSIEAGHLATTIDRLHRAADALAERRLIDRIEQVSELTEQLVQLPGQVPDLEVASALEVIRALAASVENVVDQIAEAVAA